MVSNTRVILIGAGALVFLAFVAVVELRTLDRAGDHTRYFGRSVAPLLWEVNAETAHEYVELMLDSYALRGVEIVHDDGSPFVGALARGEPGRVERILRAAWLIRDRTIETDIDYREQTIGALRVTWVNRNVFLYVGALLVMGVLHGVLESLVLSWRSLRARERAERALAESRVRLHSVVSGTPVILFALDADGRFTLCEGRGMEKLGWREDQPVGRRLEDLPGFAASSVKDYRRAMAGETFTSTHESEGVVFDTWHAPLRDAEGHVSGVIGVSTDITELRRALDALEERDRNVRRELALAKSIHRTLMPTQRPRLEGCDFGMLFVPSGDVGGDFVDFFPFDEGRRLSILFADITGHGVPAALLSAMFKVLINDVLHRNAHLPLATNVYELNRRVAVEFPPCNFASTFCLVLEARTRRLTYVNAAQEPALLLRADGTDVLLETGGPAVGLIPPDPSLNPGYAEASIELGAGDTLFLYTDGLVEIADDGGRELGRDLLVEWLRAELARDPTAQALVDGIYTRVLDYAGVKELPDDVAVVAIRGSG
jgi:serine phosphatase RsbU (regulator of sigma subunit)/PAS domain-containing protein